MLFHLLANCTPAKYCNVRCRKDGFPCTLVQQYQSRWSKNGSPRLAAKLTSIFFSGNRILKEKGRTDTQCHDDHLRIYQQLYTKSEITSYNKKQRLIAFRAHCKRIMSYRPCRKRDDPHFQIRWTKMLQA